MLTNKELLNIKIRVDAITKRSEARYNEVTKMIKDTQNKIDTMRAIINKVESL